VVGSYFCFHLQNQHLLPGLRQVHRPVGDAMRLACLRRRFGNQVPLVPAPATQSSPDTKSPVRCSVPGLPLLQTLQHDGGSQ
jgi:hypothetical protein